MGCGCGGASVPQSGPVSAAAAPPPTGPSAGPGTAYTALVASGDHQVFRRGSSEENRAAARLHAGLSGGGQVRVSTGTEALTGQAQPDAA